MLDSRDVQILRKILRHCKNIESYMSICCRI